MVKGSIILVIAYTTSIRSVRPRFIIHNLLAPEKMSTATRDSSQFYSLFSTPLFLTVVYICLKYSYSYVANYLISLNIIYINIDKYNASYPHIVHMFLRIQLKRVFDNECYQTRYTAQYTSCISVVCYCATLCLINAPSFKRDLVFDLMTELFYHWWLVRVTLVVD